MIYYENASHGKEGLNTHLMSWTLCISLSNFLDRDFYFDCELPSSTPPEFASMPEFRDRFRILLESPRSLISQLVQIPNRRISEIDTALTGTEFQLVYSHFATTEAMRTRFAGTMLWDSFAVGRRPLVREELAEFPLIEWRHTKLSSPAVFYLLPRDEKAELLDSVRIRYLDSIEKLAGSIADQLGRYYAIHLRLGDYERNYGSDGYNFDIERFGHYARGTFSDDSLPVLIATDGLDRKDAFRRMFGERELVFIDEMVFGSHFREFSELEFTDFNVLSIINQLLCASAESFIGTYRSTFTGIIHRLRQERYGRKDFNFFPDEKVARLLGSKGQIVPDQHGFFDWNRYSVFAESHSALSWMREWDFDLSTIDV